MKSKSFKKFQKMKKNKTETEFSFNNIGDLDEFFDENSSTAIFLV